MEDAAPQASSEIQRGEVPKVTVKEVSNALPILKAKVVVDVLVGRGEADELLREETAEVLPHVLQERVGCHQRGQAVLVHGRPEATHPGEQRFWGDRGMSQTTDTATRSTGGCPMLTHDRVLPQLGYPAPLTYLALG